MYIGVWRSWLARIVRDDEVAGSSPATPTSQCIMFFVYILNNSEDNVSYVGATGKLPQTRLTEHNIGSNTWTSTHGPFTLIYYESYHCKKDALHREQFLKSGQGRKLVTLIIDNYAVSAKGGPASGGGYPPAPNAEQSGGARIVRDGIRFHP